MTAFTFLLRSNDTGQTAGMGQELPLALAEK